MKKVLALAACLMLLPLTGHATASGWVTIKSIHLGWDSKLMTIVMNGTVPNPFSCNTVTDRATVNANAANNDYILSIATTALVAGKEVSVEISDTECTTNGMPKIRAINIR